MTDVRLAIQTIKALRYATALVEQRISVEAPANAAICRDYVDRLTALLAHLDGQQTTDHAQEEAAGQVARLEDGLTALVTKWTQQARTTALHHATMGVGWDACAKELADWLTVTDSKEQG